MLICAIVLDQLPVSNCDAAEGPLPADSPFVAYPLAANPGSISVRPHSQTGPICYNHGLKSSATGAKRLYARVGYRCHRRSGADRRLHRACSAAAGSGRRVVGIGRRAASLRRARQYATVTHTTQRLDRGVADAELVIVCTPVGDIVEHVCQAAQHCPRRRAC